MDSNRQQVIAETAQRLRDDGNLAGAEDYLRTEVDLAVERGDLARQIIAMQWLATTLAFDERRIEGVGFAEQAFEASGDLAPSLHVQCALTLGGLLAGISEESNKHAEQILLELDITEVDAHYEDMRLQRLHSLYRRWGRVHEAQEVELKLKQMRASGLGFADRGEE